MKQYPFDYRGLIKELNRMARGLIEKGKAQDKLPHSDGLAEREAAGCLRRASRRIQLIKDGQL